MDKSENNPKIGIFGGAFDPIHIGHLIIGEFARIEFHLKKIMFIPLKIPPHKEEPSATQEQRFKMLKMSIADNPFYEISDIELTRKGTSYTYDTLMMLKKKNAETHFFFLIGEDSFKTLAEWHRIEELTKEVTFLVAPRTFGKIETIHFDFPVKYKLIHSPRIDISSSFIRNCIFYGKSVKYLVQDEILNYIKKEKIYGSRKHN